MTLDEIKQKAEPFFEWPSDRRDTVTYPSAMLFAQECVKETEARVLKAIEDEPEYPGEIPEELRELLDTALASKDIDLLIFAIRQSVKLTKEGITARVKAGPSRFLLGDSVRLWKPGHAEHGLKAAVAGVMTIQEYGGPVSRGPHAYRPDNKGWYEGDGEDRANRWFGGPLPDAMVTSEESYQTARSEVAYGKYWRE